MDEREVVVFIGLQGSGKSTFFQRRFAATHRHVSKDQFHRAKNKNARQHHLIEQALASGHPVVVDNTHPLRSEREPVIAQAKAHGVRVVGYYFPPDVPASLDRNRQRTGRARVPDKAIHITAAKLQPPAPDEGFDELYEVHLVAGDGFEVRPYGPPDPKVTWGEGGP